MRILNRIQFTRHFIELNFVETKQLVGNNPNVILARQTCSQPPRLSSRALLREVNAERSHFVFPYELVTCFEYRIVEESRIYICARLAQRMPLPNGDFRGFL